MTPAASPISPDESVYRRIHKNQCAIRGPQIILPAGFRPSQQDTAGLSVYRESFVTAQEVAAAGRKPGEYYVVRLSVGALLGLGLTVVADEQPQGPPGHASIPELSLAAYQDKKVAMKIVLAELARLASQEIVHRPDP